MLSTDGFMIALGVYVVGIMVVKVRCKKGSGEGVGRRGEICTAREDVSKDGMGRDDKIIEMSS